MGDIVITDYNPEWAQLYEAEAERIRLALGELCLSIHHFGSTAVPGLPAKPKIDILAVVLSLSSLPIPLLLVESYENRGEVIPSGRYFSKKQPTIHLHIFEEGNPLIQRNLLFRDWLRTHESDRNAYAILKRELACIHTDGMSYCKAKSDFIEKILAQALG